MQDLPKATTLLDAVSQFIDEKVIPELSGRTGFHARVARNVLAIIRRELLLGAAFEAAQKQRLEALVEQTGTIEALNHALCAKIADKTFAHDDPALRAHLRKATMGKLAVDQPKYASYRYAQSLGWPEEDGYSTERD